MATITDLSLEDLELVLADAPATSILSLSCTCRVLRDTLGELLLRRVQNVAPDHLWAATSPERAAAVLACRVMIEESEMGHREDPLNNPESKLGAPSSTTEGVLTPLTWGRYVEVGGGLCRDAEGLLWTNSNGGPRAQPVRVERPTAAHLMYCMRGPLERGAVALGLDALGHVWELPAQSAREALKRTLPSARGPAPQEPPHPIVPEGLRIIATLGAGCTYTWRPVVMDARAGHRGPDLGRHRGRDSNPNSNIPGSAPDSWTQGPTPWLEGIRAIHLQRCRALALTPRGVWRFGDLYSSGWELVFECRATRLLAETDASVSAVAYTSVRDDPALTSTRIYILRAAWGQRAPAAPDVVDIPAAVVTVASSMERYWALTTAGDVWEWGYAGEDEPPDCVGPASHRALQFNKQFKLLSQADRDAMRRSKWVLTPPRRREWTVERPLKRDGTQWAGRPRIVDLDGDSGRLLALVAVLDDSEDDVPIPIPIPIPDSEEQRPGFLARLKARLSLSLSGSGSQPLETPLVKTPPMEKPPMETVQQRWHA